MSISDIQTGVTLRLFSDDPVVHGRVVDRGLRSNTLTLMQSLEDVG